jgi:stage III sporulation protein AD
MDIIQIVLIGMVATLLYIVLKDVNPSFAYVLLLITSIFILFLVIKQIGVIIQLLQSLGAKAQIQSFYIDTILKIIGIAYITELGSNITKDAGLSSVSAKIELAGKIFILLLAIPIITAVVEAMIHIIPVSTLDLP